MSTASTDTSETDGVQGVAGTLLDSVVSGLGVAVLTFVPLTVLNFAFGADWVGVKYWLFVVAMLLFGVSLWLLRPDRPWEDDDEDTGGAESISADIGHFEATVHALPPLSWAEIPPDDRASSGLRLFLASTLLFLTSYVMENVFSVCVPSAGC